MDAIRFIYKGNWLDYEVYVTRLNHDSKWVLAWFVDVEQWKFVDASRVEIWVP